MTRLVFCLLILITLPFAAWAERRVALIIGNDAYSEVAPLDKAVSDAVSIAEVLNDQGYETVTATDTTRRQMNRAIATFTGRLQPGDTAVLFFAGHGVEIDGENYLLPTDIIAPASGERDFIKSESIALSSLLNRIRATGARTTIGIIDACRNNPFQTTAGRSIGRTRGLGRITAPQGTFVIFSAGAGQLALDELDEQDTAKNSVFTRLLLPRLSEPDLELRALVADLRTEVRDLALTVNHQQFPAYYDELLGDFYFTAPTAPDAPPETQVASVAQASPAPDTMRQDFDLARSLNSTDALQSFLDRYADRKDEFTYSLALQLLQKKTSPPAEPRATSETPADPLPVPDRRSIIQQTQSALNEAGCSAGVADGIAGPRTRNALGRFIADTGAAIRIEDLGTEKALRTVRSRGTATCTATTAIAPAQAETPSASSNASQYTLAGHWQFRASCPLFIKTTGTARYTKTGANSYRGVITDSLGQTATAHVTQSGRSFKATLNWSSITTYTSGRLSADGNSYTDSANNGCKATAWRTN